jgi:hypothetical protein
MELKNGK